MLAAADGEQLGQADVVLEIQKCATNIYLYEEISTTATSKRTPEGVEHIISCMSLNLFVLLDIFNYILFFTWVIIR